MENNKFRKLTPEEIEEIESRTGHYDNVICIYTPPKYDGPLAVQENVGYKLGTSAMCMYHKGLLNDCIHDELCPTHKALRNLVSIFNKEK